MIKQCFPSILESTVKGDSDQGMQIDFSPVSCTHNDWMYLVYSYRIKLASQSS